MAAQSSFATGPDVPATPAKAIQETLAVAGTRLQTGDLDRAEQLCRRILERIPARPSHGSSSASSTSSRVGLLNQWTVIAAHYASCPTTPRPGTTWAFRFSLCAGRRKPRLASRKRCESRQGMRKHITTWATHFRRRGCSMKR